MTFILSGSQARELQELVFKIRSGTVTNKDIDRFQYLVRRTNYNIDKEFHDFLIAYGYIDVKTFLDDYHNQKNKEFIDGLVKIGLGILAAYALSQLFKEK